MRFMLNRGYDSDSDEPIEKRKTPENQIKANQSKVSNASSSETTSKVQSGQVWNIVKVSSESVLRIL